MAPVNNVSNVAEFIANSSERQYCLMLMQKLLKQFFEQESAGGILLLLAAVFAMCLANSPLSLMYTTLASHALFWVNEVAMTFFFLLVGLELKRGYLEGNFSHWPAIGLPVVGALGGMILPALIYVAINWGQPLLLKGWATPVATDIAFAFGILMIFGRKIPNSAKLFLLTLAIFDDIGAMVIISVFYSQDIAFLPILLAFLILLGLYLLSRRQSFLWIRGVLGVFLWLALLKAGIHPTLAGVLLAFMIPGVPYNTTSSLYVLERRLHPWVAYGVMPIFALLNAGVSLQQSSLSQLTSTVVWGVAAGLFLGKQAGVFGFCWIAVKCRFIKPLLVSSRLFYGVCLLCGIGFTMSLFLGTLAFQYDALGYVDEVRLGVIIGSLLSGLLGAYVLLTVREKYDHA